MRELENKKQFIQKIIFVSLVIAIADLRFISYDAAKIFVLFLILVVWFTIRVLFDAYYGQKSIVIHQYFLDIIIAILIVFLSQYLQTIANHVII
jgi:hypothetical protein